MKVCLIEACEENDKGSIGAFYVKYWAEKAGYKIDVLSNTRKGYDVEMISIHHCRDYLRLARKTKKRAKYRIIGGHPMQNNPRPIIYFSDAVFIGEAESHIGKALKAIEKFGIDGLKDLPGWIVSKYHKPGDKIPETQIENPLPKNPPYLNRPGTRSAAWYVELARGCPYKCFYCELGNSTKYRIYKEEDLKETLIKCDLSKTRKINFYAPDEASHPDYNELYLFLKKRGFAAAFSSMRIESIMRKTPKIGKSALIRVGIDGLTEETRKKINKPITNKMIIDYFKYWTDKGHVNFKMFMMFGYPWEKLEDFNEFENLMRKIFFLPIKKNVMLRIKWTPFIPQPCTPFGRLESFFDERMAEKINIWHMRNKMPHRRPGFFVTLDGLMSAWGHRIQCELTKGDEFTLQKIAKRNHWDIYKPSI